MQCFNVAINFEIVIGEAPYAIVSQIQYCQPLSDGWVQKLGITSQNNLQRCSPKDNI